MKRLSFVAILLITLVWSISLTSCSESSAARKELAEQTNTLNSYCPQSIGMAGDLVSAVYDEVDNRLTMTYSFNPQIASFDVISANKDRFTDMLKLTYSDNNMSDFISLIEKTGCSFAIEIKVRGNDGTIEILLSPEDIKEIQSSNVDEAVRAQKFLDFTVFSTDARVPLQIDEATVLVRVSMSDSAMVYDYTIDESLITLDQLKELSHDLKNNVAMAFRDPSMQTVVRNLAILDKGLVYRYTDSNGKDFVEMVYSPDELRIY